MKRQSIYCIFLLLIALTTSVDTAVASNVTPKEAFGLVGQHSELYLLDVRTPGEYQQIRLKGSHLIPIDQFAKRLTEVPRNRPILVYCAVGSRSAQVASYLARQGYPEIFNLSGGIYAWAQAGYPVLKGGP